MCLQGIQTCTSGVWGPCEGQRTILIQKPSPNSIYMLQSLAGRSASCNNLCDPACQYFQDTPSGVDAGANLLATDAGMSLAATSGSCSTITVTATPNTTLSR